MHLQKKLVTVDFFNVELFFIAKKILTKLESVECYPPLPPWPPLPPAVPAVSLVMMAPVVLFAAKLLVRLF